jgi:hypothetical protein
VRLWRCGSAPKASGAGCSPAAAMADAVVLRAPHEEEGRRNFIGDQGS